MYYWACAESFFSNHDYWTVELEITSRIARIHINVNAEIPIKVLLTAYSDATSFCPIDKQPFLTINTPSNILTINFLNAWFNPLVDTGRKYDENFPALS